MNKKLIMIAILGSCLLLGGAFAFEYIGGMPPCEMCIWQRWPHALAIVVGFATLFSNWRPGAIIAAILLAITSGIGFYHMGVEKKWWLGPSSCTGDTASNLSADDLLTKLLNTDIVRCDEVPWELFNISMAGWNGILSLILALLWVTAAFSSGKK